MKNIFIIALKKLARAYIRFYKPFVVWITWSIGKTSCRMIVHKVINEFSPSITADTSPKNFNSDIGLCLAILWIQNYTPTVFGSAKAIFSWLFGLLSNRAEVLVLEYGIDAPGDMDVLLDICVPQIAIFTGLDKVHTEYFESVDDILTEKTKLLYAANDIVFYPVSAGYLDAVIDQIWVDTLSYGLSNGVSADISFDEYDIQLAGDQQIVSSFVLEQWFENIQSLRSNMIGEIFAWYIALWAEIAMILAHKLDKKYIWWDELFFELQAGRFTVLHWKNESILIDSTYNAAPKSMEHMIDQTIALRNTAFSWYQLVYCMGDMRELWEFSESEHRKLAGQISQSAEQIFLIWKHTAYTYDELIKLGFAQTRIHMCVNAQDLGAKLVSYMENAGLSMVLFKSSQWDMYLEEAIPFVLSDPEDKNKLPRQEQRRKKKKERFFDNLEIA